MCLCSHVTQRSIIDFVQNVSLKTTSPLCKTQQTRSKTQTNTSTSTDHVNYYSILIIFFHIISFFYQDIVAHN